MAYKNCNGKFSLVRSFVLRPTLDSKFVDILERTKKLRTKKIYWKEKLTSNLKIIKFYNSLADQADIINNFILRWNSYEPSP